MAISAGNYIIRSAMDENIVLLTSGGSKSKGANIAAGALTEADNRCYWKLAVKNTSYNQIYNLKTGSTNGSIMAATVAAGKAVTQGAYSAAKANWLATLSGNTMTVNGVSVNTYFLTAYGNSSLYLTAPENGGNLYLSAQLDDTTPQEFYFEASTYVNTKLATPTGLTLTSGDTYIINAGSATALYAMWKSSSTATIYEQRYRTRIYDSEGFAEDWGDWSPWSMVTASKYGSGLMRSTTSVSGPAVDNSTNTQADVQIEVRLTSAKNSAGYNKTGTVTHGPAVSGLIRKWKTPTLTLSAPVCKQYGLGITYSSDYAIAGNLIRVVSIMDGAVELVKDFILTKQDYQGEILIPWDAISVIPAANDSLDITVQLVESNGIVSVTQTSTLTVTYDSEAGMSFTPTYTLTSRLTVEAKITAYDLIECYLQVKDLNGKDVWVPCEEIASDSASYRYFEIIQPFGSSPTVMWVVQHTTGGATQWGYKKETLGTGYSVSTLYYTWNWIDDDMMPHAFIMKYRAGAIVQPEDASELPASRFLTTGRDYPVYRYSKSIQRKLDIEGAIINGESDTNCTKADAEKLLTANHTVYRQPNGKWYQTALTDVTFTREVLYTGFQISQEAESR